MSLYSREVDPLTWPKPPELAKRLLARLDKSLEKRTLAAHPTVAIICARLQELYKLFEVGDVVNRSVLDDMGAAAAAVIALEEPVA